MSIVSSFLQELNKFRDPRTNDWFIVKHPSFIFVTIGTYLYVSKILGPRYMRDRKAFDLRLPIMIYNIFQVVANVYFFAKIVYLCYFKLNYSLICQPIQQKTDADSIDLLNTLQLYFFVRVADFLDTFFFILKKKQSHITVLHVVHHTLVVSNGWLWLQYGAEGQVMFTVCLNAAVHIIMYSYYFLAALGPWIQPYLWWKRYLTRIQITQFVFMITHMCLPMVYNTCNYSPVFILLAVPQVGLIMALFVNFYVQSYIRRASNNPKMVPHIGSTCMPQILDNHYASPARTVTSSNGDVKMD